MALALDDVVVLGWHLKKLGLECSSLPGYSCGFKSDLQQSLFDCSLLCKQVRDWHWLWRTLLSWAGNSRKLALGVVPCQDVVVGSTPICDGHCLTAMYCACRSGTGIGIGGCCCLGLASQETWPYSGSPPQVSNKYKMKDHYTNSLSNIKRNKHMTNWRMRSSLGCNSGAMFLISKPSAGQSKKEQSTQTYQK